MQECWTTLRNAELILLGMSGKGLGAVLLATVVLCALYLSGGGTVLVSIIDALSAETQRND